MNNRTKKKRDKQLLGELWQQEHEPKVKHWGVACKHSMKHYEQERRRFIGCRNATDVPLIMEMDKGRLDHELRGTAFIISKKDIIRTSTLDLSTKKVQRVQHSYVEPMKRHAEMTFTIEGATEGDYEEILKQLMQGT